MKTNKQKAIKHIKRYLDVFKKGDHFHGLILSRYVREKIGKDDMFPDTVLRYLREMRSNGIVNYEVQSKSKSEYIKL